jgi:hypothetical protein
MLMCCVCAFSLHRESLDRILGDEPLISEVVLSHSCSSQQRSSIAHCSSACTALSCSICCWLIWALFMTTLCLITCSCTYQRCLNSSSMIASICSSESCSASYGVSIYSCGSWFWASASVVNATSWADGRPIGPFGLPVSTDTLLGCVEVCGWLGLGTCVLGYGICLVGF